MKKQTLDTLNLESLNPYQSPADIKDYDSRPFCENSKMYESIFNTVGILSTGTLILGIKMLSDYFFKG